MLSGRFSGSDKFIQTPSIPNTILLFVWPTSALVWVITNQAYQLLVREDTQQGRRNFITIHPHSAHHTELACPKILRLIASRLVRFANDEGGGLVRLMEFLRLLPSHNRSCWIYFSIFWLWGRS
jgi:hypothetical protein